MLATCMNSIQSLGMNVYLSAQISRYSFRHQSLPGPECSEEYSMMDNLIHGSSDHPTLSGICTFHHEPTRPIHAPHLAASTVNNHLPCTSHPTIPTSSLPHRASYQVSEIKQHQPLKSQTSLQETAVLASTPEHCYDVPPAPYADVSPN